MTTNTNDKLQKTNKADLKPRIRLLGPDSSNNFTGFFSNMSKVNTNSADSKLNETSIDDNRGGRIELNQDNIIKK
ncbi:hypothetical protein KBC75_01835 [Candidatus Shapirobacteria bacterium]|nr:hypothetical protein [Candidatus Shapirobacteria bacterium]